LTKQTTSLSLSKPEITDKIVDTITQLANNFDILDSSLADSAKQKDTIAIDITDKRFGAKCDGVTDDTNAIQSAIDYVESIGGGKIIFPYRKTVKTSMKGSRSIQTWHTGVYSRRYSLLVGNNVEIDFNYCTISCQMDISTGNPVPINIIGNKLASNTDVGNSNITIRNGVFDQNVQYLVYDPTGKIGNNDVIAMEFNNTEKLVLENITLQNVFGYGLWICNSRNFKVKGKTIINNVMGCSLRVGWSDNTKYGEFEDVEIHNNSDLYNSLVPGNTVYVVAEDIRFKRIYQTLDTQYVPANFDVSQNATYKIGSTNFANGCNNIRIDECYSYYLGFKIQDYSNTATGSPDNMYLGKMYFSNTFFNQQSQKCYINELILENGSFADSMNGVYCYINKITFNGSGVYTLKGNYAKHLYVNEIISLNSPSILCSAPNANVFIHDMFVSRNSTLTSNTINNYLVDLGSALRARIGRIVYSIGSSDSLRLNNIKIPIGGSIGSVTGTMTSTDGLITTKMVDNFNITLTAGTQTTIYTSNNSLGSADTSVYKNGNNMHRVYELMPMNPTARAITISSFYETQYGERLVLNHSTAAGGEPFYIKVLSFEQLPTVAW
jgi:hypothetical protein